LSRGGAPAKVKTEPQGHRNDEAKYDKDQTRGFVIHRESSSSGVSGVSSDLSSRPYTKDVRPPAAIKPRPSQHAPLMPPGVVAAIVSGKKALSNINPL